MNADNGSPANDAGMATNIVTVLRPVAAVAIVIGGLVHLQLYFDGYRDVPNANLGRSFLVNGFGSMIVAVALLARRDIVVRLAAIGLVVGTLIAFVVSRTDTGVFGFTEEGFQPSPQAALTVIVEIVALVALIATFVPMVGAGRSLPLRALAPTGAAVLIGTVVMCVLWNREPDAPAAVVPAAGSVTVADFSFAPPVLTVSAGTTVTWTNQDGFAHTVDATDDSFVSESLGQGVTFTHTFDAAGTFAYICGIHPSMAGTVVVTE